MYKKKLLLISLAMINSSYGVVLNNSTTDLISKKAYGPRSNSFGSIGLQNNQLVEEVGNVVGNKYFGDINIGYNSDASYMGEKGLVGESEFKARINDTGNLMFSAPNLYIGKNLSNSSFAIGRKVVNWSQADANWGLGRLNNRINFELIDPGQEGLTGVHYDLKIGKYISFGFFGSVLNVPELNPSLDINESKGTVSCSNPWCKAPAESAPIEGAEVPIFYNVNMPEISDVALKNSYGLNFMLNSDYDGKQDVALKGNVFYVRKPENTLSITAEVKYEIEEQRVFVDVTPEVYYHDVSGGNVQLDLKNSNIKINGGFISIVPEDSPDGTQRLFDYTGLRPNKIREDYVNGSISYSSKFFNLTTGYIARVSEFDRENDILVEYPRWNQAVQLNVESKLTDRIGFYLDYKYDMLTEDRITMFQSNYRFDNGVVAGLGFNIIGTNTSQDSYWSDFENNDSVYSSLKYIF